MSAAARRKSLSVECLLVSDVAWMSRDHIRAILRKEAIPCKTSKAEMQSQVRELIAAASGSALSDLPDSAMAARAGGASAALEGGAAAEDTVMKEAEDAHADDTGLDDKGWLDDKGPAAKGAAREGGGNEGNEGGGVDGEAKEGPTKESGAKAARESAPADSAAASSAGGAEGGAGGASDGRRAGSKRAREAGSSVRRSDRDKDKAARSDAPIAPNSLAGVQRLLREAEELSIGTTCDELGKLQAMLLRAQRWRVAAREAMRDGNDVPEAELDRLLDDLATLPLRLQERSMLQQKLASKRWLLHRRSQLNALLAGRPPIDKLEALTSEATALGLGSLPEVEQAAAAISEANGFVRRAERALKGSAPLDELRALQEEAAELAVIVAQEAKVVQRIDDSAQWNDRATSAVTERVDLATLQQLLKSGSVAAVPAAQLAELRARESIVQWWLERAAASFVKDGCRLTLLEVLKHDGRFELLGPDGAWCATLACPCCTGEDPAATAQFMIGCDKCDTWFHGPCVGVSKAESDSMDDYLCPYCAGESYAFGPPLPVPKLTRRPKLRYVTQLLSEAEEIGVDTQEATLIREIETRAQEWQSRAWALLSETSMEPARWRTAAVAMAQESESLEVRPDALEPLAMRLSRMEEWAEAATSLGVPSTAPTGNSANDTNAARDMSAWDAVEEAAALFAQTSWLLLLPEHDVRRMGKAVEQAHAWRAAARSTLGAIDAHYTASGSTPTPGGLMGGALAGSSAHFGAGKFAELRSLHAHISDGRLPVAVMPEEEELRLAMARYELLGGP